MSYNNNDFFEVPGGDENPSEQPSPDGLLNALKLDRAAYQHLSDLQFKSLQDLILKYHECFALDGSVIGCVPPESGVFHYINTGEASPVTQKPYRLSHHESCWLKIELKRLLRLGVIRPSSSPWMSPVVLVKKPNGGLRLCVDMRALNKCSVPDPYPLPNIDDVHSAMGGCRLWSQMDYVTGFWQVLVNPEDVPKTGFTTPHGNFEFVRMAMGMMSAPSTFQRLMDNVLRDLEGAKTYIDDTFTFTDTFEQHMVVLEEVFRRCLIYNLKMNPLKCKFCVERVTCLGHVITHQDGKVVISPVDDKVAAIMQLPRPHNVTAMKRFLGMCGFYRKYIDHYANITAPLELMTHGKGRSFVWTTDSIGAFDDLKHALCSAPVLALPDWDQPFVLTTDWSRDAIGAVLAQVDPVTGDEHPIAYASRALTPAESNYAATEGECLAVKWAVEKFRYYLHGRHFTLRTDHQALKWLDSARFTNSKLERWCMALQEYDFSVEYIQGVTNVVADHLSRTGSGVITVQLDGSSPSGGAVQKSIAMSALVVCCSAWPEQAVKQSELDQIACDICHHAGGADNMAICSVCQHCFHLRCVLPPMSSVPSGDWICYNCDVYFENVAEMCDPDTVLSYCSGDPYLDDFLLAFVRSGRDESVLEGLPARRAAAIRSRAAAVQVHPRRPDWLMVYKFGHGDSQPGWLTCPPLSFRWDLVRSMHDVLGHAGVKQTVAYMQQHFHWRGLYSDVKLFVKQCDACQRRKLVQPAVPPLQEPAIRGPFEHVHIDLCGPFATPVVDVHGQLTMPKDPPKAYVVIMVDYFTKAAEFAVVYSKSAANVARAFYYSWICRYFVPSHVTSDNGTEFDKDFVHLLARLGIKHIHTSAAHPAANGAVERLVGSFKSMLTKHVNAHPEHWLQSVPVIRMQYWSRLHSALGMSPQEMVFGRQPRVAMPLINDVMEMAVAAGVVFIPDSWECDNPAGHVLDMQRQMAAMDQEVFSRIRQQFVVNAAAWPRRGANLKRAGLALKVGDFALEVISGPVASFHDNVKGPFRVLQVCPDGTVLLSSGSTQFKDAVTFKRHITNLAVYYDKKAALAACK